VILGTAIHKQGKEAFLFKLAIQK